MTNDHLQMLNDKRPSARLLTLVLLLVSSALLPGGCQSNQDSAEGSDGAPQRIVSLVPAVTETLFAIGAGDRVVGVSNFDAFPEAAAQLPTVGALLDPNLERIFELRPDLVVTYGTQSTLSEQLREVGIPSFPFVSGSIGDMLESVEDLGEVIGDPAAGRDLAARISTRLANVQTRAPLERPSVLIAHSRDPGVMGAFYSEGGPSYLNELIEIAGGRNLFGDVEMKSFQPSLEEVLVRGPEIIVELLPSSSNSPEGLRQRRADWETLETLPAVRNGRVHVLADDYLLLIGPRLHLVAEQLADIIHSPE